MEIKEYLALYDSYIKTLIKTNPTDFTEDTLKEEVISTVETLKPYRLDEYMTRQVLTNILRKYQRAIRTPDGYIDHYDEYSVDSSALSHILLKYLKPRVSFHYAYLLLQQEVNCRVAFAEDILFREDKDIEEAVLLELTKEKTAKAKEYFDNLLIHERKDLLMNKLHELLDYKKGKYVAVFIKAMEQLNLLKPYNSVSNLHALIIDEFGDIGSLKNFTNYINGVSGYTLLQMDIEKAIMILESI